MVDLVTNLPEDKCYISIYIIVDQFSKEIVLFLVTKNILALDLAHGIHDHV